MLKHIFLASTVAFAAPAFAQEAPPSDPATVQQTPAAPAPESVPAPAPVTEATPPAEAAPAETAQAPAPAQEAAPVAETAQAPAPAQQPTQQAQAQPANDPVQVAQVVGNEFRTYDKDANGSLNQAEFGNWMVTLRKASEPSFDGASPAGVTWVGQAFAAADADKDAGVSQSELTRFLSPS
jgi:outer membrane biosynthesis protein TonB